MRSGALSMEKLRELLPDDESRAVASIRLEMTPHRAFRFLLLGTDGRPHAVAELDESAERCLPPQAETLSGALRALLPQPLFQGDFDGRPLCVRPFFDGTSLENQELSTQAQLSAAEEMLAVVQAERRSRRRFDEAEYERFVTRPLRWIRECARFEIGFEQRLDEWVETARQLVGSELDYSLHHGDFQFSNLLRASDGGAQIIDWELSQGEAPVWMDRVHLAIAHRAALRGVSYGSAAAELQEALGADSQSLPYSFATGAMALEPAVRRGAFLLCVLHGMAHFLRRVPHLAHARRIEDFLAAGDAFRRL